METFRYMGEIGRMTLKIIYPLYIWYWMIPIRFSALAFLAYFGLIYLIYGSLQPTEIKEVLESNGLNMFFGFLLPFGIPFFLSLGTMFGMSNPANAPSPNALERAIQFRNGQMSLSSDKRAAEILEKTAHLDVMQANKGVPIIDSAVRGFDAKYGASCPTKVFHDIFKK